jgi:hypothetical protein
MISDMYAPSLSERAIHAAMNGVNQLEANPDQSWGSAYQMKKSWSSVGVARKSQLYVHVRPRIPRRSLSAPSAAKKPITIAVASEAAVSSRAVSAPLQYGPEVSADQKRCESKLASTYLTVVTGILYFVASFASVPSDFSEAMPSLIC